MYHRDKYLPHIVHHAAHHTGPDGADTLKTENGQHHKEHAQYAARQGVLHRRGIAKEETR